MDQLKSLNRTAELRSLVGHKIKGFIPIVLSLVSIQVINEASDQASFSEFNAQVSARFLFSDRFSSFLAFKFRRTVLAI